MRILRPQYGMKDAGRAWQATLNTFLVGDGFERSSADPCVYRKVHRDTDGGEHELIIATHVDDLLILSSSPALRDNLVLLTASELKARAPDLYPLTL